MSEQLQITAAQQGIYLGQCLAPDSPIYNAAQYFDISGTLNPDLFVKTLTLALEEAEGLRISFAEKENICNAFLHDTVTLPFVLEDLTQTNDSQSMMLRSMREDLAKPIQLEQPPLFRNILYKLSETSWVWYFCAHHILLDGYGFSLITKRISELYSMLSAECSPKDDETVFLPIKKAVSEDEYYRSSRFIEQDKTFWIEKLAKRSQPVTFSTKSAEMTQTTVKASTTIEDDFWLNIAEFSDACSTHWGTVFIALTGAELYSQTGIKEHTLGIPVMNRLGSSLAKIPCMHMNIVPFPIDLDSRKTFTELVKETHTMYSDVRRHQRYRYEDLRRDLSRVGGQKKLFGPVINIMPFDEPQKFAEFNVTSHTLSAGPVEDLAISIIPLSDNRGLHIEIEGNAQCYDVEECQILLSKLMTRLKASITKQNQPAVSPDELKETFLLEYNTTAESQHIAADVIECLIKTGEHYPDKVAVRDESSSLTYSELIDQVQSLAILISSLSPDINQPVGIMIPRSSETIITILAILWSGRAYLPIDCDAPDSRKEFIINDAESKLILTSHATKRFHTKEATIVFVQELLANAIGTSKPVLKEDDSPAYVMYTSGSTGLPKGVIVSRKALAHFTAGAHGTYKFSPHDKIMQFAPFHFDASIEEIFVSLLSGSELVLRNDDCLESMSAFSEFCIKYQITVLDLPTAFWNELIFALKSGSIVIPESIRTVIIGGEAALKENVLAWRNYVSSNIALWNTYGPTETTVVATAARLDGKGDDNIDQIPIGSPLPFVKTLVLGENGRLCKPGQIGELVILGPTLAIGYKNRDDEMAERFIKIDLLGSPEKAYRTGDLVYLNDNSQLVYKGRLDFEFKISGHRINPLEIERLLITHESINDAAVIGHTTSQGIKRLTAHICADSKAVSISDIRTHLKQSLPEAVIPSMFHFYKKLPLSPAGKIDRSQLSKQTETAVTNQPDLEMSDIERIVLDCWEDVLGLRGLHPDQDFFELGGQSLQCIQVANRLNSLLNTTVEVSKLFQYPRCYELAAIIQEQDGSPQISALPSEMKQDQELPDDITAGDRGAKRKTVNTILLTGATGYVGTHLLHSLLEYSTAHIVCLVRGEDSNAAYIRLIESLENQDLSLNDSDRRRLTVIAADLSKDKLGLSASDYAALAVNIDAIYHNAAHVSVVRNYSSLRKVNVKSTVELLRLASTNHIKQFHYVSTQAVLPHEELEPILEEKFYDQHDGLKDGYQQTKWMSENLINQAHQRGIPASIYRLGRVSGSTRTSKINTKDLYWSLIGAGLNINALPQLHVKEIWTPVDIVGKLIATISQQPNSKHFYNIAPDGPVDLGGLNTWLEQLGFDFTRLPISDWLKKLRNNGREEDQSLIAFFEMNKPTSGNNTSVKKLGRIVNNNVKEGTSLTIDELTYNQFKNYVNNAVDQKHIAPPTILEQSG